MSESAQPSLFQGAPSETTSYPAAEGDPSGADAPRVPEGGPSKAADLLAGLNPEQRQAVTHEGGPCLVLAGAGSGKTRVLTHRIAWLVAERGVSPVRVCAVTFTNKAAAEMRQRVRGLLGERAADVWLSTFHSLGLRLLREAAGRPGAPPEGFSIYDRDSALAVWRRCQSDLRISAREHDPARLYGRCSHAVNRLEDPASWDDPGQSWERRVAGRVWKAYRESLERAGAVDFDDLLHRPLRLLSTDAEVRNLWRGRFHHLLVDEYQDTNRIQYRLIRALLAEDDELLVVGDEDQSIYRWRGADLDNVLDFQRDFPNATVVRLEQNYRSTQPILSAAGSLVAHNRQRLGKSLWTETAEGDRPVFVQCATERDEAVWVTGKIEELADRGRELADIAVLYRTNAQSRRFEEVLLARHIPHRIVGGLRFFARREVRDVLSWLRLLVRPDDAALRRAVSAPNRGIGKVTLEALAEAGGGRGAAVTLERLAAGPDAEAALQDAGCPPGTVGALLELRGVVSGLRDLAERATLPQLIDAVLERTGYGRALADERDGEERLANIEELVTAAAESLAMDAASEGSAGDAAAIQETGTRGLESGALETDGTEAGGLETGGTASGGLMRAGGEGDDDRSGSLQELAHFLDRTALLGDADSVRGSGRGVALMTVHAAKGLEFDTVFLAGMEEELFPHASAIADGQLEEERRLCYVGMTRARRRLFLSAARSRSIHGRERWQEPSRFISEIDPRHLIVRDRPDLEARSALGRRSADRRRSGDDGSGAAGHAVPSVDASRARRGSATTGAADRPPRRRGSATKGAAGRRPGRPASSDELRIGASVYHPMFGPGEVTGRQGSGEQLKLRIRFRRAGTKTIVARYAKLEVNAPA